MNLNKENIKQIESEHDIYALFDGCGDVIIKRLQWGSDKKPLVLYLAYCEGMINPEALQQVVYPELNQIFNKFQKDKELATILVRQDRIALTPVDQKQQIDNIINKVFTGQLLIYYLTYNQLYFMDIAEIPGRAPEEASTEVSVRGPRDGLVENIAISTALIRKRLPTASLNVEQFIIGKRSQTRVALLYMYDVLNKEVLERVRERLKNVDIDILISTTQLEELICDKSISLFPLLDDTARPDFAAEQIDNGRFVIVIDGNQTCLIGPATLTSLLKSAEDAYSSFWYISFQKFFRLLGLLVAIFLPGFYAALISFHQDQLPFRLLATIKITRMGIPLPPHIEIFFVLGLFELFREAGIRMPKAVGQTLAVVGGLIIGDASIRAGLASPLLVVVVSITAVSTFTLVNQTVSGAVSLLRLFVLTLSAFLGLFGFFIASFLILLHLARLKSFDVTYLSRISPLSWPESVQVLFRFPWSKLVQRSSAYKPIDKTRQGGTQDDQEEK